MLEVNNGKNKCNNLNQHIVGIYLREYYFVLLTHSRLKIEIAVVVVADDAAASLAIILPKQCIFFQVFLALKDVVLKKQINLI